MDPAGSGPTRKYRRKWSTAEKEILTQLVRQQRASSHQSRTNWKKVSATLKEHGYRRTRLACLLCWNYMVREARKVRTASITSGGTQMFPSVTINVPYSDKRAPIHPGTDQNNSKPTRPEQFADSLQVDEVPEGAGYRSNLLNSSRSQPGLAEQPTSDIVPSTPLETRPTLLPAVEGFESITVEVAGPTVDQQDGGSRPGSTDNLPRDKNPITLQSVITGEAAGILSCERDTQIGWVHRRVEFFEAEIQKLKCDAAARTTVVTSINQEIEHYRNDYDILLRGKDEEIAKVLREVEEKYNKKCEMFESRLENLDRNKQTELRVLKRRELEVSHTETALAHFQAIIDYYAHEETDDARSRSRPNGSVGKETDRAVYEAQ